MASRLGGYPPVDSNPGSPSLHTARNPPHQASSWHPVHALHGAHCTLHTFEQKTKGMMARGLGGLPEAAAFVGALCAGATVLGAAWYLPVSGPPLNHMHACINTSLPATHAHAGTCVSTCGTRTHQYVHLPLKYCPKPAALTHTCTGAGTPSTLAPTPTPTHSLTHLLTDTTRIGVCPHPPHMPPHTIRCMCLHHTQGENAHRSEAARRAAGSARTGFNGSNCCVREYLQLPQQPIALTVTYTHIQVKTLIEVKRLARRQEALEHDSTRALSVLEKLVRTQEELNREIRALSSRVEEGQRRRR